jgi:hypothetical protein
VAHTLDKSLHLHISFPLQTVLSDFMDQTRFTSTAAQLIQISMGDRWQVYHRLQELGVSSSCLDDGGLTAEINTPLAALQLWSVTYPLKASRSQLIQWLHRCWQ